MAVDSSSSFLNLGLDQMADLGDPQLNNELQGMYNALHTLNAYMESLRQEFEGSDSQDPSESLRFRRRIKGTALQAIQAGNIISSHPGGFVNGCKVTYRNGSGGPISYIPQLGSVGIMPRHFCGFNVNAAYVALTDAAVGEEVTVGVDTGVIKIDGFVPGAVVWALSSRHYAVAHGRLNKNFGISYITGTSLYGDGRLYTGNNFGSQVVTNHGHTQPTEGYWTIAPYLSGDWLRGSIIHAFPVGVCIAPGFVYVGDYAISNWPRS